MQELVSSRRMPATLRWMAASQDLVVTRAQLAALGIGHEGVAARTRQGVWRDLGPRVVVLHSGQVTQRQRAWVGFLHAGRHSVLAGPTATELGGLRGYAAWEISVAVPHGSELGDLEHPLVTVRVHQTRHPAQSVVPGRTPARHTMARAVVETASTAADEDLARALLAAAVQQRLVRPSEMDAFLETRRTMPRRRLLRETIDDVAGGAHSLPELEYARALRRAGLPEPTRQRLVRRPHGSYYLDNDFEPWLVTVEVNGSQHDDARARDYDDERRGRLQAGGRLVVDLSSYVVRRLPRVAVLRTADALLSRGWVPPPRCATVLQTYRQLTA
ncbi:MAG: hypothetical protein ABI807_09680 [Sporichthyaceae bacterium]